MLTPRLLIIALLVASGFTSMPGLTEIADKLPNALSVSSKSAAAEVIVVFAGGGGKRVRHAAALAEAGYAKRILILGTNPEKECALSILDGWFPEKNVEILLPECALPNTDTSAKFACSLLTQSKMDKAIIVSDEWHLRRISLLMARYGNIAQLGYSAPTTSSRPWWVDVRQTKNISTECIKLAGCAIMSLI